MNECHRMCTASGAGISPPDTRPALIHGVLFSSDSFCFFIIPTNLSFIQKYPSLVFVYPPKLLHRLKKSIEDKSGLASPTQTQHKFRSESTFQSIPKRKNMKYQRKIKTHCANGMSEVFSQKFNKNRGLRLKIINQTLEH